jgi:signal transduction histidine kinase
MMGVVSHDLKNPLSTISMAASFLLEEVIPDDGAHAVERKQIGAVQRAAERMLRLIHDLLDVTAVGAGRITLGKRRVQSVEPLIDDAADVLRPLAEAKRVHFVVDVAAGLPRVDVDRDRLLQVISNLGGNAIKFTPEGGKVCLTAACSAEAVEFTVSDT